MKEANPPYGYAHCSDRHLHRVLSLDATPRRDRHRSTKLHESTQITIGVLLLLLLSLLLSRLLFSAVLTL